MAGSTAVAGAGGAISDISGASDILDRPSPPRWATALGNRLADAFYLATRPVLLAAVAIHFRRVSLLDLERFPRSGAALLTANHPSTWSDVLLLEALLGRRLHFLAEARQFHPAPRAALIRLFGTLPVYLPDSAASSTERNEKTFRRCRTLFDRGNVVAIFPEGMSRADRALMPLKRGAARLALSHAWRRDGGGSFAIVPVALRYSDRTAFRCDVTVRVGEPIPRSELRSEYPRRDPDDVDRLTERIADKLRALAVIPEDADDGPLLAVLEPIAAGGRDRVPGGADALERSVSRMRRGDPEGHARLRRLAHAHARALKALRVSDRALLEASSRPAARSAGRIAVLAILAIPALAGAAIHVVPAVLTQIAIRRCGYDPSQIAFARISAGFFFLSSTYAILAWLATRAFGARPAAVVAGLVAAAALGVIALAWGDRWRSDAERWRLSRIARRHPRLVERARESEAELSRRVADLLRAPRTER